MGEPSNCQNNQSASSSFFSELARIAQELPKPILSHLTDLENVDLVDYFNYESNIYDFGERMIMLSGLAICSIYIANKLANSEESFRADTYMDDHIRTILFLRGFDRGLACAVIQRAGVYQGGIFGALVKDDRPVTDFITQHPRRLIDMIQQAIKGPLAQKLVRLIEHLGFMKRFYFPPEAKEVLFDSTRILLEPFLLWNGHIIERFSSLICKSGETPRIVYSHWSEGIEKNVVRPVEPEAERTLIRLATLFNIEGWDVPSPDQEALPQSVMPLFADSYPTLNRLAHKLVENADQSTRENLWFDSSNIILVDTHG
jgi:hypothetical protein